MWDILILLFLMSLRIRIFTVEERRCKVLGEKINTEFQLKVSFEFMGSPSVMPLSLEETTPLIMSSSTHTVILKYNFSLKEIRDFFQKRLLPGLGWELYKMSLEYLIIPESKEAIKDYQGWIKRTQEPTWGDSHWPKIEQFEFHKR